MKRYVHMAMLKLARLVVAGKGTRELRMQKILLEPATSRMPLVGCVQPRRNTSVSSRANSGIRIPTKVHTTSGWVLE